MNPGFSWRDAGVVIFQHKGYPLTIVLNQSTSATIA
jgi:hypothetical protein